jgi:hypothetical protein
MWQAWAKSRYNDLVAWTSLSCVLRGFLRYVMQHDTMLEYRTVEETLMNAENLKLKNLSKGERKQRVENIMAELGGGCGRKHDESEDILKAR